MQTFKNIYYTSRNYDCTNIVACVAEVAPNDNWQPTDETVLAGLEHLWTEGGVRFYGYL